MVSSSYENKECPERQIIIIGVSKLTTAQCWSESLNLYSVNLTGIEYLNLSTMVKSITLNLKFSGSANCNTHLDTSKHQRPHS